MRSPAKFFSRATQKIHYSQSETRKHILLNNQKCYNSTNYKQKRLNTPISDIPNKTRIQFQRQSTLIAGCAHRDSYRLIPQSWEMEFYFWYKKQLHATPQKTRRGVPPPPWCCHCLRQRPATATPLPQPAGTVLRHCGDDHHHQQRPPPYPAAAAHLTQVLPTTSPRYCRPIAQQLPPLWKNAKNKKCKK